MEKTWKEAIKATLHCLTGCAVGDIVGMTAGMSLGLPAYATFILAVSLAFIFGYTLTIWSVTWSGVPFRKALAVAFVADTVSILTMELVANGFVYLTGAVHHSLGFSLLATAVGFIMAFILTVPVNKILIAKGLGHAKAHQYHDHSALVHHKHHEHHNTHHHH